VQETPLPILIEMLNSIFDIFADGHNVYDRPVFIAGKCSQKLQIIGSILQQRLMTIKKKRQRILYEQLKECLDNLKAFIDYKANEMIDR